MIPLRLLFRSRWAALAWAIGICWTAIDFAGTHSGSTAAEGNAVQIDARVAEGLE